MSIVVAGRTYGLGAIIALLVLIAAFVLALVGGVSPIALLAMIGFLALAQHRSSSQSAANAPPIVALGTTSHPSASTSAYGQPRSAIDTGAGPASMICATPSPFARS